LIGDGRSDFCVAREASFVFAKGRLADHCEAEGIPHMRIRHLGDVVGPLARRLTLLAETA
jgi:2-hydroxy-3-keto-5-methylthiopentenyl-1-phosphate phosphatase